jgi:predicted nucleic acid-binding protein
MIYGADTTFLVQLSISDTAEHRAALGLRDKLLDQGGTLALAPQVLAEFVHIVTDRKRFLRPLTIPEALRQSSFWWNLAEAQHVFPTEESVLLFHSWMEEHRLGRKRILDTSLAAIFRTSGIHLVISSDPEAFRVFDCFEILDPVGFGNE